MVFTRTVPAGPVKASGLDANTTHHFTLTALNRLGHRAAPTEGLAATKPAALSLTDVHLDVFGTTITALVKPNPNHIGTRYRFEVTDPLTSMGGSVTGPRTFSLRVPNLLSLIHISEPTRPY